MGCPYNWSNRAEITLDDTHLNFRMYYDIKGSREALATRNQICVGTVLYYKPSQQGKLQLHVDFSSARTKYRWGWLLGNRPSSFVCVAGRNSGKRIPEPETPSQMVSAYSACVWNPDKNALGTFEPHQPYPRALWFLTEGELSGRTHSWLLQSPGFTL